MYPLITTFPPIAWDVYARECLKSMAQNWPGSVVAYIESPAPSALDGVEFRPFTDPDRKDFLEQEITEKEGYLFAVKRFCHKVFAQLEFSQEGRPFWWVDADVMIFRKPSLKYLEQKDFVTFFGRDSYTETGMIGFNPEHEVFWEFAQRYREMYTKGKIFELKHWTDCHAFDAARDGGGHNLSPNGKGMDNVIAESRLGKSLRHFKGRLKYDIYRGGADAHRPGV